MLMVKLKLDTTAPAYSRVLSTGLEQRFPTFAWWSANKAPQKGIQFCV